MPIDKGTFDRIVEQSGASRRDVIKALSAIGATGVVSGLASADERETQSIDDFDIGLETEKINDRKTQQKFESLAKQKPVESVKRFLADKGLRLDSKNVQGRYVTTNRGSFTSYEVPVHGIDTPVSVFENDGDAWARVNLPGDMTSVDTKSPKGYGELFVSNPGIIEKFNNNVTHALKWQRFTRNNDLRTYRSCYIFDIDTMCAVLTILLVAASISVTILSAGAGTVIAVIALDAIVGTGCSLNTILEELGVCGDDDLKFCLDGMCWTEHGQWVCTPYPTDLTIKPLCP